MQEIPLEKPNKLNESENKNILFPLIIIIFVKVKSTRNVNKWVYIKYRGNFGVEKIPVNKGVFSYFW